MHTLTSSVDSQTEAYRARYYALPGEVAEADAAHAALIEAVSRRDAAAAVRVQDDHRERALSALRVALRREQGRPRAAS
jgi:DNA-binding GntR family transcriptional regulator